MFSRIPSISLLFLWWLQFFIFAVDSIDVFANFDRHEVKVAEVRFDVWLHDLCQEINHHI